jgi:neutral ceramidase
MRYAPLGLCLLVASHLAAPPSYAVDVDAEWKVGLARVDITPTQPIFLSGYASRNHPYERIETKLYAKALAFEDRNGNRAVLVTTDLIGLPAAIAEPICERLHAKTGLKREQILLNSSHIHTGPALSLDPSAGDHQTPGDAARTAAYTRDLQEKIMSLVQQSLQRFEPARLSWGTGVAPFVMNRREFTPRGVILGVNARGPADRSIPVLRVDTPDGKLRAVIFGAAVHNTTLTDRNYEVCGDYAGFAQSYIEGQKPDVQAMFMIGCAGDANPYPRGTMALAREHGAVLGKEVCRVLDTKLHPVRGPLQIAFDRAPLPLQPTPARADLEKQAAAKGSIQSWVAQQTLKRLDRGETLPSHYTCPFTVWQFDQDLTLVGLPGEVVVDYVHFVEEALGPNQLWVAAYCNDVFGYLPSARVLREGGYETRGLYTGGIGLFDPKAEQVVVAKVRELAEKAGRKLPAR